MRFFHILNFNFQAPNVDEVWLQSTGCQVFCLACGERLKHGTPLTITIDAPFAKMVTGAFGYPNVGIVERRLIELLAPEIHSEILLGQVVNCEGQPLPDIFTLATKTNLVPVRGFQSFPMEFCRQCGALPIGGRPRGNRYIVSKGPLSRGVYESTDSALILREDLFSRIKTLLTPNILIEELPVFSAGFDGCELDEAVFND